MNYFRFLQKVDIFSKAFLRLSIEVAYEILKKPSKPNAEP